MDYFNLKKIKSWGKYYSGNFTLYKPKTIEDIQELIFKNSQLIISGGFRSYGDSAINDVVVNSVNFDKIIDFNNENGILKVESGATLNEIIKFLIPKGWFLKATPGTKFTTIGGCIASDIHGKEHHKDGCFSENLLSFKLLVNKDKIIEINKQSHLDLFKATCGGMGLTGFIVEAEIQCKKIKSSEIVFEKKINYDLDGVFSCFEKYMNANYSVAWLDTEKKNNNYRSIFTCGEFSDNSKLKLHKNSQISLPLNFNVINNLTIKIFNNFYFLFNCIFPKKGKTNYENFFYPLDGIKNWYKLYGPEGFFQYQFIVPKNNAKIAILEILNYLNKNNNLSSLAVLKLHGKQNSNYLSFPRSGYSLAMDFPYSEKIKIVFEELDKMVLKHGGKVYLTKDTRLSSYFFKKFYPNYYEIKKVRQKYDIFNFNSIQSKRIGINE